MPISSSSWLAHKERLKFERKSFVDNVSKLEERLKEAKEGELACDEAITIAQSAAVHVQKLAHDRIATLVTQCLRAVFGESAYEFVIVFEEKRSRTEARLTFKRGDKEVDPILASGGGVVDVAAFALRLSCLLLSKPSLRRLLVLDEPWKHLSEKYRPAMRKLIEELANRLGVQFLIVTHADTFKVGKVIEITK